MPIRMPPPPVAAVEAARAAIPPRPEPLPRPNPTKRDMKKARAVRDGLEPENPHARPGVSKRARFTSRHSLILYMDIAGERGIDIALKLGMHPSSVSAIKGSPLYAVHKQQLMEQLAGVKFDNLLDLIRADAVKNVEMMIEMRDKIEKNGGEPKHVLKAAQLLQKEADRVFPRQTSKHTEERVVRINIDGDKMRRIATALHEIGARAEGAVAAGVTADDVLELDATRDDAPPLFDATSIDEARNALLAKADDFADAP